MNPEQRIAQLEAQIESLTYLVKNHKHKGYDGTQRLSAGLNAPHGFLLYDNNGEATATALAYADAPNPSITIADAFDLISTVILNLQGLGGLILDTSTDFIYIKNGALATTDAFGMVALPNMPGPPTGTPTGAGSTPVFVFDSANNDLYVYNSGAWKKAHFA